MTTVALKIGLLYLLLVNVAAFVAFGVDKRRARRGEWRIAERTLLLLAVAGGAVGAWGGMLIFRHKTQHPKFALGIPAILLLQIAAAAWAALSY